MKARFLALAALVLGLASCQTEPEGLDVNVGGAVDTTITVSIPETETRANSSVGAFANEILDGELTMRYIMKIYDQNNRPSYATYVAYSDEANVAFDVRLVPNRHYKFVVWADVVEEQGKVDGVYSAEDDIYYKTNNGDNGTIDLRNITIINSEWNAMNEERDAFTGVYNTEVEDDKSAYTGSKPINITLTRPFAKLRVVTTDMVELRNLNINPAYATVAYDTEYRSAFDALAGKAKDAGSDKKAHTTVFAIKDYTDFANDPVKKDTHKVLFTDYFFANEGDAVSFVLNVYEDAAGQSLIKSNDFNTDIAVNRNYLTTIQGNVLTDGNNIEVKVEDAFENSQNPNDKPYYNEIVEVGNATDLQEAINNSTEETTIVLGGNIDLGDGIITLAATRAEAPQYALLVPAGKSVVLDLDGYTISQSKECTANYSMIVNKGNLTITDNGNGNGKISFKDTGAGDPTYGWGSYTIRNEGTLVVENGTIEHLGEQDAHMICAIFQYSGSSTINGGIISTPAYRSARLWSGDMTINGGNFNGQLWLQAVNNTSNLTINGGTFSPCGGDSSSVFVTNSQYDVAFAVTGGLFTTKIGMSKPFGCITGGTFTSVAKEGTAIALLNSDYHFVKNDNDTWRVVEKPAVAKIGDVEYKSLIAAVAAVQDGDTIILIADEEFTETNRSNNSGWWDGIAYSGDKSFTIDLGGKTVSQDGSLNDYLIWIKNVGSKANTITIKNGTLDAGKTAYCALCTASSHDNELTIDLENVNLINNKYDGSTIKVRTGSVVNVKAGTKITGKDSYLGIENWKATVNIYDGAEIYMNGTSSYNGCLVGVGGNGTVNVYGGYGKGVSGGLIAMTSGGTINVSGGEWIANTDGTYANSNKSVLVAQSDKQYNAGAGNAVINVTGGTFKGGYNCYGNAVGDAQINIKGGNFNSNPATYVVSGYETIEENGIFTVGKPKTLADFEAAIANGGNVTLASDVTLLETITIENEVVIDLNGKTVTAPSISAFTVKTDGKLTLKNGNVTAHASVVSAQGGEVVIESGYYTETGDYYSNPSTLRYCVDARNGGKITINGGEFNTTNGMFNVNSGCQIKVNGGKFTSSINNAATRHFAYVGGQLTINDGEFLGKANGGAGGCFFCGAASTGEVVVNGGKFTSLWISGSANAIFESYYGGTITVTGGMFNTNRGIATFVTENTDEATKAAYPYVAK